MARTRYNKPGVLRVNENTNRRAAMLGSQYRFHEEDEDQVEDQNEDEATEDEESEEDSGNDTVTIELTRDEAEALKATLEKIAGDEEAPAEDDSEGGEMPEEELTDEDLEFEEEYRRAQRHKAIREAKARDARFAGRRTVNEGRARPVRPNSRKVR